MYNLPYFKASDEKEVIDFMQAHPFVMLCGVNENKSVVATQVPVLIQARGEALFLQGHMMKHSDHQKAFAAHDDALVIFTGANSYVSASWYTNPLQGSTWNYTSVHARGKLKFLAEEKLRDILERTTAHFEQNADSPSLYNKLPADYVNRLVKAIVAFEIEVTALENIFKLSQNRDEKSYEQIITQLEKHEGGAKEIADVMLKRKEKVFKDDK